MASSKDTFESWSFLPNSFASGTFRGVGVTSVGDAVKITRRVRLHDVNTRVILDDSTRRVYGISDIEKRVEI